MAHSPSEPNLNLWSAAQILALGAVERLSYNRRRYEQSSDYGLKGDALPGQIAAIQRTDTITLNVQSYRNILRRYEESGHEGYTAAMVLVIQRINNELYALHHDLLEHDAEDIIELIPVIDAELKLWDINSSADDILSVSADSESSPTLVPDATQADASIRRLDKLNHLIAKNLPS